MRWKRLIYYLVLNILVSACTVLVILYYWENYRPLEVGLEPGPILLAATATISGPPSEGAGAGSTDAPEPASGTAAPSEFITHTVQPGDTLSGLALEYDVSIEAILAANDLDNPDSLDVGDVILIPTGETVPVTTEIPPAAATATPPPPPTLPPTEPNGAPGEILLEVVTVIGPGDLAEERVVVRQNGDGQVSLQGWQILGPDGEIFTFPQMVLFQDGAVSVYTRAGTNTVAELFWGLEAAVWDSGDVVTLADPDGNIVAAYQVP
jgi:LysM repeat protein